jgi:hypothetical protein
MRMANWYLRRSGRSQRNRFVRARGTARGVDVTSDTNDRNCMGRSSCTAKLPKSSIASEVHDAPKAGAVRKRASSPTRDAVH